MLTLSGCFARGALPAIPAARPAPSVDQRIIEQQPVCVGSRVHSVGVLSDALFYRFVREDARSLTVGYYAFYSEERPWGNNWLTWLFLPALAVDMVYTRALLVFPGYQALRHGKGDVEGFRVHYRLRSDGSLEATHGYADDDSHNEVRLSADDLYAVDPRRPTVYASTWTHHLGGRGVRSLDELASRRCYGPGSLVPITAEIATDFRISSRARPAAVGTIDGAIYGNIANRRNKGDTVMPSVTKN